MAKEKKNIYTGTGHRKTSVARVTLTPEKLQSMDKTFMTIYLSKY